MKYTLHIPVEQYGFVGVEWEDNSIGSEVIAQAYREVSDAFKPKPVNEMPKAEFQAILDDLMEDHSISGDPGCLEKMSPAQQQVIQEVKKSIKRINK